MVPCETKDLPGLVFTPLMTYTDKGGKAWTAAARLRLPGEKAGGLIISCGNERDENLFPASLARQAKTLARQYLIADYLGCEEVFWYVYKTWEGTTDARRFNREPFFGVVRPKDDAPKPALVALKALAAARPVGSKPTREMWRDQRTGFYFPQWTMPDGTPAGALWRRAHRVGEPPHAPLTLRFASDKMRFTNHLGADLGQLAKPLGGGRYELPVSDAVIYFHGGRLLTPAEKVFADGATKPHPRLFQFPTTIDPRLRHQLLLQADNFLKEPPVKREFDASHKRILGPAGNLRDRIVAFATAYRLTNDAKYAEAAKREMLNGVAWEDWNPSHWLDTDCMLFGMAIGYDWLYDYLDARTRAAVRAACLEKGLGTIFDPKLNATSALWWRWADNNWNTSCWGSTILALLALNGELPDRYGQLVSEAAENMRLPILLMAPKGAYAEGPGYWGSVADYMRTIDALESALGDSFGLAEVRGLNETVDYLGWMRGPSGSVFNYSDCGCDPLRKISYSPAQMWLAHRLNRHDTAIEDRREMNARIDAAEAKGELAALGHFPIQLATWGLTAPAGADLKGPKRPLEWSSGGTQPLVVLRGGEGPNDAYLGIKGGKGAASHGHDDSGTFVFDADGERWALELGANPYQSIEVTKIDLWDNWAENPQRWQVLRLSNRGHNMVTIDDKPYYNFAFAKFGKIDSTPDCARVTLDLSMSLMRQATSATRSFELDRRNQRMTVIDSYAGVKPGSRAVWRFFTYARATAADGGVTLAQHGKTRQLKMETPMPGGQWVIRPANELRAEWDWQLNGITAIDYVVSVPADGKVELKAML